MIYLHQLTADWFRHFARVLFSPNFEKFRENKALSKILNLQYIDNLDAGILQQMICMVKSGFCLHYRPRNIWK